VLTADIYDPALNPLYRDVLAHYGVVALPCRVGDPDRKGKVESAIGHTQAALKGLRFETLEAAQDYLDRWDARWADTRIHGTTKRQVAVMFAEERPALRPLPVEPFRYYQFGRRTATKSGRHLRPEDAPPPPTTIIWSKAVPEAGRQHPIHLGRILQELGIVCRRSFPQAKGRIERLWATPARPAGDRASHAYLLCAGLSPAFSIPFHRGRPGGPRRRVGGQGGQQVCAAVYSVAGPLMTTRASWGVSCAARQHPHSSRHGRRQVPLLVPLDSHNPAPPVIVRRSSPQAPPGAKRHGDAYLR
jgi:hypothetical protein